MLKRLTTAASGKLFHPNVPADSTKLRSFYAYHQPFPYYGEQATSFQPRYPHFHPPDSRFGYPFTPYPLGGFVPHFRCRCCGAPQFLPVPYATAGGNPEIDHFHNTSSVAAGNFDGSDWRNVRPYDPNFSYVPRNPNQNVGRDFYMQQSAEQHRQSYAPNENAGKDSNMKHNVEQRRQNLGDSLNDRRRVPHVNGFEDQNIHHGGYKRPHDASRLNNYNFTENDGSNVHGHQGVSYFNEHGGRDSNIKPWHNNWANSGYVPKNLNENMRGRALNMKHNAEQHRQNLSDNYNQRRGVPLVNGFEDQKIACDSYKRLQDASRWKNHGFTDNDGRDGRDQVDGSPSRSNYSSESNRLQQGTGNVDRKNVDTGNLNWLAYNGGGIGGQFRSSTLDERSVNTNRAGAEFKHMEQSSRISNMPRKNNNLGSNEQNWSISSEPIASSDYNQAEVMGSSGKEVLDKYEEENSKLFQQNLNMIQSFMKGEAGRKFQDGRAVKQDIGNAGYDGEQIRDGSNLTNLYDPLPEFIADKPVDAQMENIKDSGNGGRRPTHTLVHDSNDAARGNVDASRRCQGIIDVLETEDYHRPYMASM